MAHAEKCPVCNGGGKIGKDCIIGDPQYGGVGGTYEPCHGCGGQGWVEVSDKPRPLLKELPSVTYEYDYRDQTQFDTLAEECVGRHDRALRELAKH